MPKECYHTTKGHSDYTVPPTLHCLKCNDHLPPPDPRFGTQDFWLKQHEKTLAYAKALQHWAEVAKTPWLGELCKLAECVKELRQCMELLTTFTDEDILANDPPLSWKKITSLRYSKEEEEEIPEPARAQSQSRSWRAHSWGSFLTSHFLGCSKPLVIPSTMIPQYGLLPARVLMH